MFSPPSRNTIVTEDLSSYGTTDTRLEQPALQVERPTLAPDPTSDVIDRAIEILRSVGFVGLPEGSSVRLPYLRNLWCQARVGQTRFGARGLPHYIPWSVKRNGIEVVGGDLERLFNSNQHHPEPEPVLRQVGLLTQLTQMYRSCAPYFPQPIVSQHVRAE